MKSEKYRHRLRIATALVLGFANPALAAERTEHFDKDPGWDEHNNRAKTPEPRSIRQDFALLPRCARAFPRRGHSDSRSRAWIIARQTWSWP